MRKWFSFNVLFVFILIVMSAYTSKEDNVVQNSSKAQNPKEKTLVEQLDDVELNEYDKLQKFYLDFEDSWNYDTAIEKVKEQGFYFTENSNADGKSAKVALNEEVAPMTHAKEGDSIEFSYDNESKLEYVTYFNQEIFITLLDYKKGTYFEFRDSTNYQGLYVNTYSDKAGSFTLKYSNGNEVEVDYLKLNSKEKQFKYMKLYSDKKE